MRYALLFLFVGCAAVAPRPTIVHASNQKQAEFEELVRTLEAVMRQADIPGGSIAIIENGALAHAAGIGLRNRLQPEGMTPDTTFRIASISKTVLGLAVLSLVDSGELDLDKQVSDYVPGFFAPITVRQAITHSSGLADQGDSHCAVGEGALDAWLTKYAPGAVWAPPGVIWNYANPNFAIVATVIEHLTGKPFEAVVEERVFSRAGVTATYDPAKARAPMTFLHPKHSGPVPITAFDCALFRAAGGVMMSVTDFTRVMALIDPQRMTENAVDMRRGGEARYGLGVTTVRTGAGENGVMHGGGMPGLQTYFVLLPSFGFAAFFNGDTPIGPQLNEALAKYRGRAPTRPDTTPPELGPYEGRFDDAPHGLEVEVRQRDRTLWAHFTRGNFAAERQLRWLGGETFVVDWPTGADNTLVSTEATFFPGYLVTRLGVATATAR